MANQLKTLNRLISSISFQYLDLFLVFIFCLGIFSFLVLNVDTDIQIHTDQILAINLGNKAYPPNFLFYYITSFLSGFSTSITILYYVAVAILSVSITAKYLITKKIIIWLSYKNSKQLNQGVIMLLSIVLLFCFAIPDFVFLNRFYIGKFVPNIWHNSTIVFLFPFALWLFWEQIILLMSPNKINSKKILLLSILIIINALIKPSFLLVFIPVTIIFISWSYKKLILNYIPSFIGTIVIGLLYYFIYYLQWGNIEDATNNVVIATPFVALTKWIPLWYLPISFMFSFAFPIAVLFFYYKEIIKYKPFVFALVLTIFGLLLSAFIIEEGPRKYHCNFMWQNVICTFLLFLTSITFLIPKFYLQKTNKLLVVCVVFIMHFIGGILYLLKIFITSSYY